MKYHNFKLQAIRKVVIYKCAEKKGISMPRTGKEIEKLLKKNVWELVAQKGSHKQYRHPSKRSKVTIPWHKNGNDTLHPTTEKSVLKQAGL